MPTAFLKGYQNSSGKDVEIGGDPEMSGMTFLGVAQEDV